MVEGEGWEVERISGGEKGRGKGKKRDGRARIEELRTAEAGSVFIS